MRATGLVLTGAVLATLAGPASAQTYDTRESVSYQAAKQIVNTCEAMATSKKWPIAIWVLDAAGQPVYFSAIGGASVIGINTAKMKAETALQLGMPSEAWQAQLNTPNGALTSAEIGLFPNPGGLPLMHNGKVVGAVGAGGGRPENGVSVDKLCAQAGIDAAMK